MTPRGGTSLSPVRRTMPTSRPAASVSAIAREAAAPSGQTDTAGVGKDSAGSVRRQPAGPGPQALASPVPAGATFAGARGHDIGGAASLCRCGVGFDDAGGMPEKPGLDPGGLPSACGGTLFVTGARTVAAASLRH